MAPLEFSIFNSLILAGIIQGFVFGFVVAFSKKYRAASTLLLAALIVEYSLNNLQYYLNDIGLINGTDLYHYYLIPGQLLSGAIFYWYGLKLLYPEKPLSKRLVILTGMPFVIGFVISTYLKITFHPETQTLEDHFLVFSLGTELASICVYLCVITSLFLKTRKIQHASVDFGLATVRPELRWFKSTLVVFFIVVLMWLAVALLTSLTTTDLPLWYIMWITLSVLIYWLGHLGIYKFGVHEERKKIRTHSLDRSSVIVVEKKSEHLAAFEDMMVNKKYFLDPELTLDKLASELHLSKSHLSRLINKELQTSLPDYLNNLRVEEAKYYLKHPDFANYTLVSIGLEAGFASKTTFNNTFRRITGMTPSEYKKANTV